MAGNIHHHGNLGEPELFSIFFKFSLHLKTHALNFFLSRFIEETSKPINCALTENDDHKVLGLWLSKVQALNRVLPPSSSIYFCCLHFSSLGQTAEYFNLDSKSWVACSTFITTWLVWLLSFADRLRQITETPNNLKIFKTNPSY